MAVIMKEFSNHTEHWGCFHPTIRGSFDCICEKRETRNILYSVKNG